MATKYLNSQTRVNLEKSREVWNNGKYGDQRIALWADEDNKHVWAETNGDPVYGQDELVETLMAEGVPETVARAASEGDLSGL